MGWGVSMCARVDCTREFDDLKIPQNANSSLQSNCTGIKDTPIDCVYIDGCNSKRLTLQFANQCAMLNSINNPKSPSTSETWQNSMFFSKYITNLNAKNNRNRFAKNGKSPIQTNSQRKWILTSLKNTNLDPRNSVRIAKNR